MADLCSICIENIEDGQMMGVPRTCDHKFHLNCILQWLITRIDNPTCPNCRVLMVFERVCHVCQRDFRTPNSVQIKCDLCCFLKNLQDAITEHFNIMN